MYKEHKILKIPLRVSVTIILTGILLRILEWPHATKMVLVGFAGTGIIYTFRFIKKPHKSFLDTVKFVLVLSWAINGVLRSLGFVNTLFFQVLIGLSFVVWFVMEGTAYFLDEDRKAKNQKMRVAWNFAIVIGTLLIISGSLLNIMNQDFSIPLLVFGLAIVAAYILKDVFTPANIEGEEDRGNEEFQL